jgi:hypothetical protein
MNRHFRRLRCRGRGTLSGLGLLLVVAGAAAPVHAQIIDSTCSYCPDPVIELSSDDRVVQLTWASADSAAGRFISRVERLFLPDTTVFDYDVEILGTYTGTCDRRLLVTKPSTGGGSGGYNQTVRLKYELYANVDATGQAVGAALVEDFLLVPEADSTFFFTQPTVDRVGIRFTSNIDQPTDMLGSAAVAIGGLCTTLSQTSYYMVKALNSVSSLSQGLQAQVDFVTLDDSTGTYEAQGNTFDFTVTSATEIVPVMDGMTISFADGAVAIGDSVVWKAHHLSSSESLVRADLEAFDGYRVWRSDLPDLSEFELLGEVSHCEGEGQFELVTEDDIDALDVILFFDPLTGIYELTDHDVHNDFPYRYAVSTFDRGFFGNQEGRTYEGAIVPTDKVYPAYSQRVRDRDVIVVPNPYRVSTAWEEGSPKVTFTNLPTEATIRIFTAGADYVTTLEHRPGGPISLSATSATWDLRSDAGSSIASGIYVFQVEGTNRYERSTGEGGTQTVTEPIQQVGKLIVIR